MIKNMWKKSKRNKAIIVTTAAAWIVYAAAWQMLDKGIPAIVAWIASGAYLLLVWSGNKKRLMNKCRKSMEKKARAK